MNRKTLTLLLLVAGISLSFIVAENAFQPTDCEKCGAVMRPFRPGTEDEDLDILECPGCGHLFNTRHSMKAQP